MATLTFQGELEDGLSAIIQAVGYSPFVGIVRQVAPDNDPMIGELLHGVAETPFISISSILPESPQEGVSFSQIQTWDRPVTVALIGNKKSIESDIEPYRLVRQQVISRIHLNRFRGEFATDANACLLKGIVRPRSQVNVAEWIGRTKYVSAFDVMFRTLEGTT
jgi:hypothetical protein